MVTRNNAARTIQAAVRRKLFGAHARTGIKQVPHNIMPHILRHLTSRNQHVLMSALRPNNQGIVNQRKNTQAARRAMMTAIRNIAKQRPLNPHYVRHAVMVRSVGNMFKANRGLGLEMKAMTLRGNGVSKATISKLKANLQANILKANNWGTNPNKNTYYQAVVHSPRTGRYVTSDIEMPKRGRNNNDMKPNTSKLMWPLYYGHGITGGNSYLGVYNPQSRRWNF